MRYALLMLLLAGPLQAQVYLTVEDEANRQETERTKKLPTKYVAKADHFRRGPDGTVYNAKLSKLWKPLRSVALYDVTKLLDIQPDGSVIIEFSHYDTVATKDRFGLYHHNTTGGVTRDKVVIVKNFTDAKSLKTGDEIKKMPLVLETGTTRYREEIVGVYDCGVPNITAQGQRTQ